MPVRSHQQGQQALARQVVAPVAIAWHRLVDVRDLHGTLPAFKAATNALAMHFGNASGAAALRYYRVLRAQAAVPGRPTLTIAPPSPAIRVDKSIDWATRALWTPSPGAPLVDAALSAIFASVERAVLNRGRDTVIGAVEADPHATGWARVAEPSACAFCAMLTTRGAVYKNEETADFEAHDHCACSVEALFDDNYKPSAQVQGWQNIYADATSGLHGDDALNAFRRSYERSSEDQ